jgi:P27 family predicted phage terminase small subunit
MRGPKPIPTRIKELKGNPGKRALNDKEPKPDVVIPECPDHLTGEARKEWGRITAELQTLGIIAKIDRAALAAYCMAWLDFVYASRMVDEEGEVITSKRVDKQGNEVTGGSYLNPWVGIKTSAMDRVVRIGAEFGLTPASRTRLKVDTPSEEDLMASFLFGKRARVTKK